MPNDSKRLKAFDARKLMEIAIEVMRESIPEERDDIKVPPAVGAVVWFPAEKRFETAYRGELRDGDHGEYTLLERKLGNRKLDGCVLFTTLEPCMERNPPKLCCARRVILSRIKKVYVGIEDPDITVDGKGIELLRSKGIDVEMFDRDLQEVIEQVNKQFIANANERKEVKEVERPTSFLETSAPNVDSLTLSDDALLAFCKAAAIPEVISSHAFKQRLQRLRVLDEKGAPTNNGVILFGREPRESIHEAGVLLTLLYSDGTDESENLDGPQVFVPAQLLERLKNKFPKPDDRSNAYRKDKDTSYFQLVREGIVNAIVHRDYTVSGAKIQVSATLDTVTIKSPGAPVAPITMKQLKSLNAPMRSRNPTLHYVFSRMKLAEERGLGLKSMRDAAEQAGLPRPEFSWEEPYLVLRLYRSTNAAESCLPRDIRAELNGAEIAGYEWMKTKGWITSPEYAQSQGLERRSASLHLKKFFDLGIVERQGRGRASKHRAK